MKRGLALLVAFTPALASCDSTELTPRQTDHQLLAKMISEQKGRFHFQPATGSYPPMILDTATGCVDALIVGETKDEIQRVSIGKPSDMGEGYCRLVGVANVSSELVK